MRLLPNQGFCLSRLLSAGALTVLALLPAAPSLAAENWVKIATTTPNVEFMIDIGGLERNGDVVRFRERLTFLKPEKLDPYSGKLIKEKKVVRVMNCQKRTQGVKSGGVFDPVGKLIEWVMVEEHQVEWFAIPPGTVAEREFKLVCAAGAGNG